MSFFAKTEVNSGRQPELDYLKAVCIVAMIINHVLIDFSAGGEDSFFMNLIDGALLDMIGAVPFMMCMGIGMCYSKKQAPINNVVRGIILLTIGQLLNLLKDVLPNLIAYWVTDKQWFIAQTMMVLQADILSFAGFALLLMGLFKKLQMKPFAIMCAGFGMNILSYILYQYVPASYHYDNYIVSQLLGFIMITDAESYFPLLCNFVFVAAGYWIGGLYPYIEDKNKLANRVLAILTPLCVLYYAIRFNVDIPFQPEFMQGLQFKLNLDVPFAMMNALVMLGLFYKLSRLTNNGVPKLLGHFSYNINNYYCLSFMFILPVNTYMMATRGHLLDNDIFPIFYAIFVIVACYFLVELYKKKIKPQLQKLPKACMYALLAATWIFTVATIAYGFPKIKTPGNMWNEYLVPEFEQVNAE